MYKYKNKDVIRIYRGGSLLYERYTEIIEPMLVTPSDFNISISSASDLEIDWGDGTVQTVKSGDDTTLEHLGLISNKYTHTYTDSYIDKTISVKHLDGASPIQFFSSDAVKAVQRWYSEGYQPFELINPVDGFILIMTFFGLGSQLETVPNIAPPKTNVLSGLFQSASIFNQDISGWDVSNVTNLSYTFAYAAAFNQPIGSWNVSNVTDLSYTFAYATVFNQPIGSWNVSNVTNMSYTFAQATVFNQDIGGWDTSSVTTMRQMFTFTTAFNSDISGWDVSKVTDMTSMFYGASSFDQPIGNWDVSNVTNMHSMFYGASVFDRSLDAWDVSNVTNMSSMFYGAATFNQDLSGWDVSNITTMFRMFRHATAFNGDISGWDVSKVVDMTSMFQDAISFNQNLSQWCVPNITSGPTNFSTNSPLTAEHKPVWGTCPVKPEDDEIPSDEMHFTTLAGTVDYVGTQGDQILLSDGTIVEVTSTDGTFTFDAPSGKHKVKFVESIGRSNYVSVGGEALVELHNFPTLSSVDTFDTYLSPNLVKVPTVLPSNITGLGWMFQNATAFNQDISMWDTSNVLDMTHMFYNATSFNQDISGWDTSNVTSMRGLFAGAIAFNQPLNSWDVSNVTNMDYMFNNATSFNQDISQWCVSNLTITPNNFAKNSDLPLEMQPVWGTCPRGENQGSDIDDALFTKATYVQTDTSNVMWMDVEYAPENINGQLHIDWGDGTKEVLDPSDYEDEYGYFISLSHSYNTNGEYVVKVYSTTKVNYLNLGEITKVIDWGIPENLRLQLPSANLVEVPTVLHPSMTDLSYLFQGAVNFNQDISMWDTTSVTDMSRMFQYAELFNQPIGNWNVSNVTTMRAMFSSASVFNQDISDWDTSNVTNMDDMFYKAFNFTQDLSQWCVPNITSKPISFDDSAPLFTVDKHPVWGTCPRGENSLTT